MNHRSPSIIIPMLAATAAACGGTAAHEQHPSDTPVAAVEVQARELTTLVPVSGTVAARRRAEITTRMMARVSHISVDVGDRVAAGRTLITLGTEDIAANRAKAEAAVAAATVARNEAARQAARMDTLLAQDAVAEVQRDQARLGLAQTESQLAMARAALREVETAASYATITAPFAGAVVSRNVDEGDVAAPGMPLLVLEDSGARDGVLAVPVELAAHLREGSTVTARARDGREADATVRAIAAGADPMMRTVEVRLTVPSDWPTGMAITALIPTGTSTGVAIRPEYVVRRGQLTGVRVATAEGTAIRWIRLGRTRDTDDGPMVEVVSGLEPGDRIVP